MSKKSATFEVSMTRLEEIVKKMESGNLQLDDAMALFEEGTALVKSGNSLLDEAELKIKKLMKGANGAPVEGEFDYSE